MPSRSWNAGDGMRLLRANYAAALFLLFISFGDACLNCRGSAGGIVCFVRARVRDTHPFEILKIYHIFFRDFFKVVGSL